MLTPPSPVRITGAADAEAELLETAAAIGLLLQTVRSDLPAVTSHWEGRRRLEFDDDMHAYISGAEALAAGLIGLAAAVGERARTALAETLRREAEYAAAVERERRAAG